MCEVCVESHLGTSVPDPSEIAEILNLKTLQLQISHKFHNPALFMSREKDASEKQIKVNQKSSDQHGVRSDTECSVNSAAHTENRSLDVEIGDDENLFENPFLENDANRGDKPAEWDGCKDDNLLNPFMKEIKPVDEFQCQNCRIKFSDEGYLSFHNEVFHNVSENLASGSESVDKVSLKLNFVDEGEELMETFNAENESPPKKRSRRNLKYPL